MVHNETLDQKINDAAYKSEQISDIAACAILAVRQIISPEERILRMEGVLYGIISLSNMINSELNEVMRKTDH